MSWAPVPRPEVCERVSLARNVYAQPAGLTPLPSRRLPGPCSSCAPGLVTPDVTYPIFVYYRTFETAQGLGMTGHPRANEGRAGVTELGRFLARER